VKSLFNLAFPSEALKLQNRKSHQRNVMKTLLSEWSIGKKCEISFMPNQWMIFLDREFNSVPGLLTHTGKNGFFYCLA